MTAGLLLAIDGGNHKTDVALVRPDGSLAALVRGPGSSPQRLGPAGAVEVLTDLVGAARARAGVDEDLPFADAGAFLSGVDLPAEVSTMEARLGATGWSARWLVVNDTFALLRAGTSVPWGVAAVCGGGINCVGVAPDGRRSAFLALGQISGDWGGGYGLGREVLWWAMRAEDGRGPETALRGKVCESFSTVTVADAVAKIHLREVPGTRVAELTPLLFAAAAAGDEVADRLVDRLAGEIAVMVRVTMGRLDLLDLAAEVVLGGGVLTAGHARLTDDVTTRVAAFAPGAVVRLLDSAPIVGAASVLLDRVGAHPDQLERLRAELMSTTGAGGSDGR
jgi:N-acetylglucosamine kinase-like BadF-type ATPase